MYFSRLTLIELHGVRAFRLDDVPQSTDLGDQKA